VNLVQEPWVVSPAEVSEDLKRNRASGGVSVFQDDAVPEPFELRDQPLGGSVRVAADEGVAAQVGVNLAGAKGLARLELCNRRRVF
jgi:hypothetical protein